MWGVEDFMKYLKTLILLCFLILESLCLDNAFDYSEKNVCDDKLISISSGKKLGVKEFLDDCVKKEAILRREGKSIEAIRASTGFITNDGFKDVIEFLSQDNILSDLKILDLSYNRATKDLYTDFSLKIKKILNRPKLQYFDIHGNYLASIDSKDFFADLDISQLKKVIWIQKEHLNSLGWSAVVGETNDRKKRTIFEIKEIKSSHLAYYQMEIRYKVNFNLESSPVSNPVYEKISDWGKILEKIRCNKTEQETTSFEYLKELSTDKNVDLKDRDQCRLELAKFIVQNHSSFDEEALRIAARIFNSIVEGDISIDDDKFRGEASYYLADMKRYGIGMPCDYEESNRLFENSRLKGYKDTTFSKRESIDDNH